MREEDILKVLMVTNAPLSQDELTTKLRQEGLVNVRDVLGDMLSELEAGEKIFIHPRRANKRQPISTYALKPCTENVPANIRALIPNVGIKKGDLELLAKSKYLYSKPEVETAIAVLITEDSIEIRDQGKAKIFFKKDKI